MMRRPLPSEWPAAEAERAVKALAEALGALADGNLSHRIDVPFAPYIDRLRTDYNAAVTQLQAALQAVGSNARTIDADAEEIRVAADGLARRTEQQAASVEKPRRRWRRSPPPFAARRIAPRRSARCFPAPATARSIPARSSPRQSRR